MLINLLQKTVPNGGKVVGIPEALLYALIGFLVVLAGIAFLILIVWLVGKLLAMKNGNAKPKEKSVVTKETLPQTPAKHEEVDEETVAVIMAALTAYYQANNPKCEFTLKRIKRIRRDDYA